jgi:hypothetical protein
MFSWRVGVDVTVITVVIPATRASNHSPLATYTKKDNGISTSPIKK